MFNINTSKKKIFVGLVAAFAAAMISGCGSEPLSKNPEAANGVYLDEKTGNVLIVKHTQMVERPNDSYPFYKFYLTNKTNDEQFKNVDKQIYWTTNEKLIDKENKIYGADISLFGGDIIKQTTYGKYDGNKIIIEKPMFSEEWNNFFSQPGIEGGGVGTYVKTKDPVPTREELSYDPFKASSDRKYNKKTWEK